MSLIAAQPNLRRQIDDATSKVGCDPTLDAQQACIIAGDHTDDDGTYTQVIAQIAPIKLGRTTYRVISGSRHGLEILGPRGGHSSLVQNAKNPDMWAHVTMSGIKCKTQWYRRLFDGTFTTAVVY